MINYRIRFCERAYYEYLWLAHDVKVSFEPIKWSARRMAVQCFKKSRAAIVLTLTSHWKSMVFGVLSGSILFSSILINFYYFRCDVPTQFKLTIAIIGYQIKSSSQQGSIIYAEPSKFYCAHLYEERIVTLRLWRHKQADFGIPFSLLWSIRRSCSEKK